MIQRPTGSLSIPAGSFTNGQKRFFTNLWRVNRTANTNQNPFLVLDIGNRVRMATKENSSDNSVLKFSYTVDNSDLDSDGINISTTTGLDKGVFQLSGTFSAGDTIVTIAVTNLVNLQ